MSACMSEFKKMFKFATNLNHKVVSSYTMDIYAYFKPRSDNSV